MSSSERPFSRRAWKARNWSSGCSGARWMFSASELSSPRMSVAGIADHARNRRGLGQALLLHQQLERPVAPAAGRDLEHAGLGALGVEDRPDVQALEQRAPGDVLGQLLDRDAGLHAPDVRLAEHQLVEGNVARGRQGDLLNGSSHGDSLRGGRPRDSLSTSNPPRKPAQPSSSRAASRRHCGGGCATIRLKGDRRQSMRGNETRNQHFVPQVEQKLNASNPDSTGGKFRIYSFRITDREAYRFELKPAGVRSHRPCRCWTSSASTCRRRPAHEPEALFHNTKRTSRSIPRPAREAGGGQRRHQDRAHRPVRREAAELRPQSLLHPEGVEQLSRRWTVRADDPSCSVSIDGSSTDRSRTRLTCAGNSTYRRIPMSSGSG